MKITAEEKKWRAESDAYALLSAEEIMADKSRKSAALKEVKAIAVKRKKEADAAIKLSKRGKKQSTKKTNKKRK